MARENPYEPAHAVDDENTSHMESASRFAWLTIGFAILAACIVVWTILSRSTSLDPILITIVLLGFMVGAYPTLALIAWFTRFQPAVAVAVFALSFLVFAFGVSAFVYDRILYETVPEHRMGMNWMLFLVPLAQWFATFCIGAGVAIHWLATHRS
ncbi:MAG: hypothetical protein AAF497_01590 [Planctomycetota bacterium]